MAHVIYLADKSALTRIHNPAVAHRLDDLTTTNQIATCAMVDLELLYSARNYDEYEQVRIGRSGYPNLPITGDVFRQALAMQRALAEIGKHRRPIPDLIIAAAALLGNATVLHYDHDFDIIAEVSDLQHEWVVPQGSL